jgi:COMPASS component SWD1
MAEITDQTIYDYKQTNRLPGSGHSTCIRFSHRGDYLASGRLDGTVAIFDIETNGVARKMRGHTSQVQSLSWSASDRYLLSASQDWKAVLWDLKDGSRVRTVRFEAPIFIAELHPQNHLLFVVALFEEQPMLVDITTSEPIKRTLPSAPKRTQEERENATEKQAAQDAKQTTTVACFSATGDHIISGTNKGWVNVISSETCQTLYSTRLTNNIVILIRLTRSGRDAVVNSSDRIIRTLRLPDFSDPELDWDTLHLEVEHKFQDLVNRLSWNYVSFSSGNGEYVTASTYMNHDIYVWERSHGSLVKILEGPKEELSAVEWHPHRPFVAAVGVDAGRVYLWSILTPQRWSALAPDFVEVEENVEYIEREDEFDIQPIEELHKRRLDREDEEVDVLTIEPVKGADWYEPGEFRMPVLLDVEGSDSEDDIVAVGTGQFRRKTAGQDWSVEAVTVEGATTGSRDQSPANGTAARNSSKRRRGE